MKDDHEEGMNRRNFIGKTLLTGAGLTATAALPSSEIAELNSAVRAIEVKGQRLPDAVLA